MARIYPNDDLDNYSNQIFSSEYQTLEQLRDGLSDQFEIFHGVHWTNLTGRAIYGEIDFLVLHPNGRLLAIEQKNIELEFQQGKLITSYGVNEEIKDVSSQITRNIANLRKKFSQIHPHLALQIDHILYLPTSRYLDEVPINVGRIVDCASELSLPDIVQSILEDYSTTLPTNLADVTSIHRFLMGHLNLVPNIGILSKQAKEVSFNLSRGLTDWVERLDFSPFRLYIQGTAGSGKTQLALSELTKAHKNHLYGLYLCFNRPLADAIKSLAPNPQICSTFHELAKNIAELLSFPVDITSDQAFIQLEKIFFTQAEKLANQFDFLIVDEGQDFKPEWRELICNMVKPNGRIIWMEDPSQTIYPDRTTSDWSSWVQFKSPVNYRSPQLIIELINELELTEREIISGNPFVGEVTGLRAYQKNDESSLFKATQIEVQNLLSQGYSCESIAVITFGGANRSKLLHSKQTQIAGKGIKKLLGYTSDNQAQWSSGEILFDTIYRFKGLSADAVIITEVDFNEFNPQIKRKLFVALTRARLKAVIVASVEAARVIEEILQ